MNSRVVRAVRGLLAGIKAWWRDVMCHHSPGARSVERRLRERAERARIIAAAGAGPESIRERAERARIIDEMAMARRILLGENADIPERGRADRAHPRCFTRIQAHGARSRDRDDVTSLTHPLNPASPLNPAHPVHYTAPAADTRDCGSRSSSPWSSDSSSSSGGDSGGCSGGGD